jgi:hypothetical protein
MKYLNFDLRALALMRICVAIVILIDLSVRISDLEMFYANTGAVPLSLVFEHSWNDYFVSLHTMSGLWQVQLVLFVIAYFFAAMLLLGYRTKLFTILSWFIMLSLHNRNSLILQGGDDLMRMVLFWAMFIPWGARYSCDAILSAKRYEPKQILTIATVAYLLQICYLYTGSALLKGQEWDSTFTAMYYVYGLDQIAYPITKNLFYYPELLKALTAIAYYFELLVPLLFFFPFAHQWFRFIGVASIVFFHAMNSMTLFIGMFPLIGIATSVGILPSMSMDWVERFCGRIKNHVRQSFASIAGIMRKVIRWKQPVYERGLVFTNIRNAILVFLVLFVFDWNFSNLTFVKSKLSDNLRFIGYSLRLDQNWGMFAPGVFKDDGWYILEGVTENNEKINLWDDGRVVSHKKPSNIVAMFKNDRWRKYTENMILTYHSFMRGYFCNYSRRVWNESRFDKKIKALRVIYMSEFTLPDYKYSKPEEEVLCECGN